MVPRPWVLVMQVRTMKGVEAVRHRPLGASPQLGVWLSLEALMALPLSPAAQLELLRGLLEGLSVTGGTDQDECRAVLLTTLADGELREACRCFETGAWQEGHQQWQLALAHHRDLKALQPAAVELDPFMDGLIQVLARLDQALTHRQWRPPESPLENARVHGFAAELLHQIREFDRPLPSWYEVVEEGLLRRGGLALLQQASADSRRQGVAVLLRWASLHPAAATWLPEQLDPAVLALLADLNQSSHPVADLQALVAVLAALPALVDDTPRQAQIQDALALAQGCLSLSSQAHQPMEIRESFGLQRGEAVEPAQIRARVEEWLEDHAAPARAVALELVWIPGARPLPHGHGQLALNLAAVLPEGDGDASLLEQVMAAFFEPLLQVGPARGWEFRDSTASLISSLRHLWSSGGVLTGAECRLLALAQGLWHHWAGSEGLAASQRPAGWPQAELAPGCCLVQPSATQLAGLRCWLLERQQLEPALVEIRRHHHDPEFMRQQASAAAADRGDALASLCALHLEEGFYSRTAEPAASLKAWAESSLSLLGRSQVLMDAELPCGSWWAVLQGLAQEQSRLPDLVNWPDDALLYQLLAGQEVVLISPLAEVVEEQHRSGRAFELFLDLPIAPYGLRVLQPPDSHYPARPHQGFEASLAACLESVDALARQRPFTVFLSAAGIYDLPLCWSVLQRYGASCLAIGPGIHARFGLDQACSRHWRSLQRRGDRWRRIC